MSNSRRQLYRELISTAVSEGFQITEKALHRLESAKNPVQSLVAAIEKIRKNNPDAVVIDVEDLGFLDEQPTTAMTVQVVEEKPPHIPKVEVYNTISDDYKIDGELDEFRSLFTSRYLSVKKILMRRRLEFTPISEAAALQDGGEAVLAAMVLSKQEQRNSLRIEVDDPSGQLSIIVSKKNQILYSQASELLTDVVIAAKIRKVGEICVLTELIYPDIEESSLRTLPQAPESYTCLISDVHVGSKHFRRDYFEKFLDWVNRGRDGVAKKISHIIIAGDLVEGIGVYPGQEKDLEIRNVEDQLTEAAKLLADIPDRITVIFSPGNHEPVRKALPQPPLQPRYRKILDEKRSLVHVSNPVEVVIDGRRLLVYHGQGLDEIIQSLPSVSYSTLPEHGFDVAATLLKYRHLAPIYGGNTQLLPTKEDRLVISSQPHLLQTGHIHVLVNKQYRGVRVVNAGAWQDQTDYQKSMALEPSVGHAALLRVSDMNVELKSFSS